MPQPCVGGCGGMAGPHSKTGRCKPCAIAFVNSDPEIAAKRRAKAAEFNVAKRHPRRSCCDCGTEISLTAKARCRPCAQIVRNADPERRRKAGETYRRRYETDPQFREAVIARTRATTAREMATNPRAREVRRENGRKCGPRNIHRSWTPEARARAGRTNSARRLAHIPVDYRDLYRDLIGQDLTAEERARIVLDHAAAEQARAPRLVREAEQQMRERAERRQREQY